MACLTHLPLDVSALLASVSDSRHGGTALFLGSVREGPDDGPVSAIEYSAYEDMAEAEGHRIIADSVLRFPGARVTFRHRIGLVPLGEASVAVVASAPHRDEAFDACRYVIEEIKKRLPVWKKELLRDGSAAWRANDGGREAAGRS